jgi:hypothetical protein
VILLRKRSEGARFAVNVVAASFSWAALPLPYAVILRAKRRISLHSPELPHANRRGSFFSSAALHQCSSALISGAFDFDVDFFTAEISNEGQNNNEATAEIHATKNRPT